MRHQISFVGGQLLPVLLGIKEFSPDHVHFIVSKESKNKITQIRSFIFEVGFSENICDPFDFFSVRAACEKILNKLDQNDEIKINLTGGTKVMVLAAQSLILERKLNGFYINLDGTLLNLPSYNSQKLSCELSINEFFEISGHKLHRYKALSDYFIDDFKAIDEIATFSVNYDKLILLINSKIRKNYDNLYKIPLYGKLELDKSTKFIWKDKSIMVDFNGKEIFKISSPNVRSLFFHAAWWELIVAREISKWSKAKELLLQCKLPFKTDAKTIKNEIDILVNLGSKLIFVECKSGLVKSEDINKLKIVNEIYGGIISKSLLVCRFKPTPTIIEKCKELNIDVFYCNLNRIEVNPLNKLITTLEELEKRLII